MGRWVLVALAMAAGVGTAVAQASDQRANVVDVGEPVLLSAKTLAAEMARNHELREWVRLYGLPEYAEVQEIEIDPPFAPYEVRLYYLKGNAYLAFGRVNVAPSLADFGVRKFIGPIDARDLDRLLTARAEGEPTASSRAGGTWTVVSVAAEAEPLDGD
ncbi:MAG: hypothetical protein AB7V27_17850 [Candidatus Binatia bacterium]